MPSVSFCFLSFSYSFSPCPTDTNQKLWRTPDWMIRVVSLAVVMTGQNGTGWWEHSVYML